MVIGLCMSTKGTLQIYKLTNIHIAFSILVLFYSCYEIFFLYCILLWCTLKIMNEKFMLTLSFLFSFMRFLHAFQAGIKIHSRESYNMHYTLYEYQFCCSSLVIRISF